MDKTFGPRIFDEEGVGGYSKRRHFHPSFIHTRTWRWWWRWWNGKKWQKRRNWEEWEGGELESSEKYKIMWKSKLNFFIRWMKTSWHIGEVAAYTHTRTPNMDMNIGFLFRQNFLAISNIAKNRTNKVLPSYEEDRANKFLFFFLLSLSLPLFRSLARSLDILFRWLSQKFWYFYEIIKSEPNNIFM